MTRKQLIIAFLVLAAGMRSYASVSFSTSTVGNLIYYYATNSGPENARLYVVHSNGYQYPYVSLASGAGPYNWTVLTVNDPPNTCNISYYQNGSWTTPAQGYPVPTPTPTPTPSPSPSPTPQPWVHSDLEYNFAFDESYAGTAWSLVDNEGHVIASGVVPEGGTVISGQHLDYLGVESVQLLLDGVPVDGLGTDLLSRSSQEDQLQTTALSAVIAGKPPQGTGVIPSPDASGGTGSGGTGGVTSGGTSSNLPTGSGHTYVPPANTGSPAPVVVTPQSSSQSEDGGSVEVGNLNFQEREGENENALMEQTSGILGKMEMIGDKLGSIQNRLHALIDKFALVQLNGIGGGGALHFGNVIVDVRSWQYSNQVRNLLKALILVVAFSSAVAMIASLFGK